MLYVVAERLLEMLDVSVKHVAVPSVDSVVCRWAVVALYVHCPLSLEENRSAFRELALLLWLGKEFRFVQPLG